MKVIIVGLGVQGEKRLKIAKKDVVATVDPYKENSNYKNDHTTNKCVWENDTCNIGEECNNCLGEWFN